MASPLGLTIVLLMPPIYPHPLSIPQDAPRRQRLPLAPNYLPHPITTHLLPIPPTSPTTK